MDIRKIAILDYRESELIILTADVSKYDDMGDLIDDYRISHGRNTGEVDWFVFTDIKMDEYGIF